MYGKSLYLHFFSARVDVVVEVVVVVVDVVVVDEGLKISIRRPIIQPYFSEVVVDVVVVVLDVKGCVALS